MEKSDKLLIKELKFLEHNKSEEALKSFDQVLKLNPKDAISLTGKGLALGTLNQQEEALKFFNQALRFNPKDALSLAGKGLALDIINRDEEALKSFERAVELEPKNISIIQSVRRAYCQYEQTSLDDGLNNHYPRLLSRELHYTTFAVLAPYLRRTCAVPAPLLSKFRTHISILYQPFSQIIPKTTTYSGKIYF